MSARQYTDQLQKLDTPFYFYDMQLLADTLAKAVDEAGKYGYKVHYALKANFDPRIVAAIRKAGLGVDCVSGNEVRLAIESGCPASEVVFAGVAKSDKEIRYALGQDIFSFNCESLQELEVINALAAETGRTARRCGSTRMSTRARINTSLPGRPTANSEFRTPKSTKLSVR